MKTKKGRTIYDIYEVFTPSTPAQATFIERVSINTKVVNALRTPGKQLIVYGHSGAGKSTLLINKLNQLYEKHIITRCHAGMTFENIMMHGFASIDRYYIEKIDTVKKKGLNFLIGAEYQSIKAQLTGSTETSTATTAKPLVPPQLTVQFLIKFYGELNCCWVLEDFHKISADEKIKTAQIMKIFVDSALEYPAAKLIAIGAVNTGREVVIFDREMELRLSQVHVPLMTDDELKKIIISGEEKLNIKFGIDVNQAIVRASSGLAAICHQLCLNCCNAKGITETSDYLVKIDEDALNSAFQEYVEDKEDSLKQDFEDAIKVENGYGDLPEIVLSIIARSSKDEMPHKILVKRVEGWIASKARELNITHLPDLLKEMQVDKRGNVLTFNERTEKYSFSNPFMRVYVQCIVKNDLTQGTSQHMLPRELDSIIERMVERMHKVYYEGQEDDQDTINDLLEDLEDIS